MTTPDPSERLPNRRSLERRQADEALRQSEERLSFALKAGRLGLWELDLLDHTIYRSLEHDRIFGYESLLPEWTYEMFLDHVVPEDRALVDEKFQAAVAARGDWNFECRIRRADGEIRWVWATGRHRPSDVGRQRMVGFVEDITERKQVEAGLENTRKELAATKLAEDEAREYAESIINTVREPVIALDQDLRVVTVSRSFQEFFKVDPEETMGQLIYDLGNRQWDIPKLRELLETILPRKVTLDNFEVEQDFATIGRRTMLLNARQIEQGLGKERIILLAIEDVTERKQAEEALRGSEESLRAFFDTMPSGCAIYEVRGDGSSGSDYIVQDFNASSLAMEGKTKEEVIGKSLLEIRPAIDEFGLIPVFQKVWQTGEPAFFPSRRYVDEDFANWYENRVFKLPAGEIAALYDDVTDRKQAEEALREKTHLNQTLLDAFPCVALLLRPQTREIVASNAAAVKVGAVPGAHCFSTWGQRQDPCPWCLAPALWASGEAQHLQVEALGIFWDAYWIPVTDDLYMHFAFDITARKRAEHKAEGRMKELQVLHRVAELIEGEDVAQEELWQKCVNILPEGWQYPEIVYARLVIGDSEFRTSNFTESAWRQSAPVRALGSIVGRLEVGYLEERSEEDEGPFLEEERMLISALAERLGRAIERKKIDEALRERDEQLRQSQKMEAVGQLAGGIAHDFNNLLTTILGYSEMILASKAPSFDDVRPDIEEIRHAAERAGALTKQILAFSRRQTLRPEVVSLNTVLRGMEPFFRSTIGENVDLVILDCPGLAPAEVDPHQFEQVLMNLVLNARDAMPSGGRLIIETADAELDQKFCRTHVGASPGNYVMLRVFDTGVGMDEATLERIFEPFFTTKAIGAGTGLGLAMVYGIVKQSGGSIFVESEPGKGTTFKIYLPRSVQSRIPEEIIVPPRDPALGSEIIMVVEDEVALRSLVERILGGAGYTILSFGSAAEALEALGRGECSVNLLLTDVMLPGALQGHDLARLVLAARPDLPILFMSGYSRDALAHAGRLDEGVNLLEKPFTPEALTDMVRQVLDQP